MAKFTQKYSLISLLEPTKEGMEFFWKDYPLHITTEDTTQSRSGLQ